MTRICHTEAWNGICAESGNGSLVWRGEHTMLRSIKDSPVFVKAETALKIPSHLQNDQSSFV